MWQVLVPITATIVPGSVTPTAGTETWASTFAIATGVPGRSPVYAAASVESPPARSPRPRMSRDILSSTTDANSGASAAK